ncbi:hypothetical protein [Rhizohabitans arisaemae]|uniref:hypothetical protein n=1 Tax=Rhizohabitans arisaemae TaxID=2720610 RepID=UPI0024B0E112|nr:hypothetical protein [Rhizohabitans arisaemae]
MHVIEFRVGRAPGPAYSHVDLIIDGDDLRKLTGVIELPFARADGHPDIAGAYAGLLERDEVLWPSRHFLGEPTLQWFFEGETVLLGCECGEWGCWPLTAQVEVSDQTVTWSGFRNGHRPGWTLDGLGPFVFSREQYEAALRQTENTS